MAFVHSTRIRSRLITSAVAHGRNTVLRSDVVSMTTRLPHLRGQSDGSPLGHGKPCSPVHVLVMWNRSYFGDAWPTSATLGLHALEAGPGLTKLGASSIDTDQH